MNDFGKFLAQKRLEVGLTQKQLAEKLFVSESTISKWEKNKANPDISVISELSKILNVTEHELITASEDKAERERNKYAKKWKTLTGTLDWVFILSYLTTIVICFICNLAVSKKLDWFFIVLFSLNLAASFTTYPKFIKRYKLLFNSIIPLISLILLLTVCNIYSNGSWLILAIAPIILGFIMVFLPIYIGIYCKEKAIRKLNSVICVFIDTVLTIAMLFIICKKINGSWFGGFALPVTLFCGLFAILISVISVINFSKLLKTSIILFLFIPFSLSAYQIIKILGEKKFNTEFSDIYPFDFLNWEDKMIGSNVIAIILFTVLAVAIAFLICYLIKKFKKRI